MTAFVFFTMQINQMYNCGSVIAVDAPGYIHAIRGKCNPSCGRQNGEPVCNFKARYRESVLSVDPLEGTTCT